jgi:hypothetical protein
VKYHIEVRSWLSGMGKLECKVVDAPGVSRALEHAYVMAVDALDAGADEVTDIWVVKDEDWCANRWTAGLHFSFENMKMGFRMYRNEVQE